MNHSRRLRLNVNIPLPHILKIAAMHAGSESLRFNPCLLLSQTLPVTTTEPVGLRPWRFHHVWPGAALLFAAVANVAWIAALGYGFIRFVL